MRLNKVIWVLCLSVVYTAKAAVVPEYAENSYTEHALTRSEQKCIDEGYKITYANCSNQTAPADRCPHHDSYYRSCSQEQWCRNNNYTFAASDCKQPTYPTKICDNQYPIYRACQEDTAKSCKESGYTYKDDCQLTDTRCPYNNDYGKCCTACEGFDYTIDTVPEGYIATGTPCTTCDGVVKTKIIEAPCENYMICQYGPLSAQTPSCLQGKKTLYTACKTAEMSCKEKGFLYSSCQTSEDEEACPEFSNLKKCHVNCFKLAVETFPESDIIAENITDPRLDISKTSLKSLYGEISKECISAARPEITININNENLQLYEHLFDRDISNVNIIVNFEEAIQLNANGTFNNVRITLAGNLPDCPLKGNNIKVSGTVSLVDFPNICTNLDIADDSKFITTGNVTGNVNLGKGSSLGIKGNLIGSLKTKSNSEILIKGIIKHTATSNRGAEDGGIIFGCDTRAKITGGIIANPSNVIIKQRTLIDTPYIKLNSTSNNIDVPGLLSSIHLHKYSKLLTTYDNTEYPLIDNNDSTCDDKYIIHLGSATDEAAQTLSIEPSDRQEDKWQCRTLSRQQLDCN